MMRTSARAAARPPIGKRQRTGRSTTTTGDVPSPERRESGAVNPSAWADLPDGVMERISSSLSASDASTCSFRLACSGWRAAHDAQVERLAPRRLDQQLLATTAALFPSVRTLDLRRTAVSAGGITDIISSLSSLANLQEVDLSGAKSVLTPGGLLPSSPSVVTSLLHLSVAGNPTVDDAVVEHLSGAMPNLTSLNLNGCEGITDRSLESIARLTDLRVLRLADCDSVTDGGLSSLRHLTSLTEIELNGCCSISDGGLDFIGALSQLEYLGLKCCEGVTDEGVQRIAACCPALTHLNLGWCSITDRSLATICSSLRLLEHLNLSWCDQITDYGASQLAELKRLQKLKLKGCTMVTNETVPHFAGLKELRSLNMKLCIQVSAQALNPLRQRLPLLLDVKSCCDPSSFLSDGPATCHYQAADFARPLETVLVSV